MKTGTVGWKLAYASGKLGLLPAFGNEIGKDVNKAELLLCKRYVEDAAKVHAEMFDALELAIGCLKCHMHDCQRDGLVNASVSAERAVLATMTALARATEAAI